MAWPGWKDTGMGSTLGGHVSIIETVDVTPNTRLHLTDDHVIILENGNPGRTSLRFVISDVDLTNMALREIQQIQNEKIAMREAEARSDEPMTDEHRKAIFAGLKEVYGVVSRQRRLSIISAIVGRKVETLSTANPVMYDVLTRAEASHVLDVLNA
jgi:hypothetical protein